MKSILIVIGALFFATTALAEESQKVRRAKYENSLEKEMDRVNAKCGTKMTVTIDWKSFESDDRWKRRSVSGYCDSVMSGLRYFCVGRAAKTYIQKNVETVTCHGAKDEAAWLMKIQKGHLHLFIPPDAKNADDFARTALLKTL